MEGCLRVVDNHVVKDEARGLVLLRNFSERVQEETITQFHDVGLVNTSDFLQRSQRVERLMYENIGTLRLFFRAKSNAKR